MPVREYECQSKRCGEVFEEYEHMDDPPRKRCRICKKGKVIRLISLPARPIVPGDPVEEYKKIKQEAKQIAQKIIKGDEKAIADIYGDDVAAGKDRKAAPMPKTLNDVKNNKKSVIKRRSK